MAKLTDLGALLLVSLILIACCYTPVAGVEDMVITDVDAGADLDTVGTSTFWKFGYKPFVPWWPVTTCSLDFSTTVFFQIVYSGTACDITLGRTLARLAQTRLGGRTFGGSFGFTSLPLTSTVVCAKDNGLKVSNYIVRVTGPARAVQRLRGNAQLASSVFSRTSTSAIRTTRGARFMSSKFISDYWCSGCPLSPDLTFSKFSNKFDIDGITYDCTGTTVANGETCTFTCDDGGVPVEDTAPVCVAKGWKFSWVEGEGGLPECVAPEPAGCTDVPDPSQVLIFGTGVATFTCDTPVPANETCAFDCPGTLVPADIPLPQCLDEDGDGNFTLSYDPVPQCGVACTQDSDCTVDPSFDECVNGICVECDEDADCTDTTCTNGLCDVA